MDTRVCRMEFGDSALTWRGLSVFSRAVGGEEAQQCVFFAIDVAAPNFSFSGRAACLLEEMRECAQFLRESYEFRNIGSYLSLFGGRVMFSTDARGHLIVTLELDSDGRDRQEACCVFHADQSSLRPFLTSLERFLRDHGAGTSPI